MHTSCYRLFSAIRCNGLMRWTLLAVTAFFLTTSCKKQDIDYGSQFVDDHTKVVVIDTITPVVSTIFVDSFSTAATGVSLIGNHTDPVFGKVSARSYSEVTPPQGIVPAAGTVFDSLVLVLRLNKTWYGDSTKPVTLHAYELNEKIQPVLYNDQTTVGTLYNTTSFTLKQPELGHATVRVMPRKTDSVVIRLPDLMGQSLFTRMKNSDPILQNNDLFIEQVLKGLCITGDATDGMILGYKDSVEMRLYYKTNEAVKRQIYASFQLNNTAHQFNHIDIDRTGTALGNAGFSRTKKQIPSSATGNVAFMQYITGSMVKIRFPSLKDAVFAAPGYSTLLRAQLEVKPVIGSFDYPYNTLPVDVRLATTDIYNLVGPDLTNSSTNAPQTGSLFVDYIIPANTSYTYDVSAYLAGQLSVNAVNENGLLLVPPAPGYITTFDRLVVGDNKNLKGQMKVKIYYMAIR